MFFLRTSLIASAFVLGGIAQADDVYISIGTDGYQSILDHPVLAKTVDTLSTQHSIADSGIKVIRVPESALPAISTVMHREFNRCGGFIVHDSLDDAQQDIISGQTLAASINSLASYTISNAEVVEQLQNSLTEAGIREIINGLTSFTNRYYTTTHGKEASDWLHETWTEITKNRSDISAEQVSHSWAQPSVMLTITGRTSPDEIVVIGGHLDSIISGSMTSNTSAPGADDDASGIATMTELISAIVSTDFKPNKTLVFIGYAAEEVGLRGSSDIASQFKDDGKNVVGVLQLDMTNYQGSTGDIYLIDDYTNASQNTFLANLISTYQPDITVGYSTCGYGCSDHASWTNNGYIASFPFEATFNGANPYIHSINDTLDKSGGNAYHALKFAKLAAAYVAELAKGNMSDTPDPDPEPEPTDEITETFSASLSRNQEVNYGPFAAASGTGFSAVMTGNNDADLYVNSGSEPTTSDYDCRPYKSGSDESCSLTAGSDDIYVMVRGYSSSASSIELTVTYVAQ